MIFDPEKPAGPRNILRRRPVVNPDALINEALGKSVLVGRTSVGQYDPVFDRAVEAA